MWERRGLVHGSLNFTITYCMFGKYPPSCEKRNGTNLDDFMEPYAIHDILLLFMLHIAILLQDGFQELSLYLLTTPVYILSYWKPSKLPQDDVEIIDQTMFMTLDMPPGSATYLPRWANRLIA
jgi:hypothetical protein